MAAIEGVDYSFSRPSSTCLKRNGKEFAVRYTSIGSSPKNMTPDEVLVLVRAGLAVVTVHQEGTGDLFGGFSAGKSHAQWARSIAGACGMPAGRPVYFALDQDPRGFSQEQWRACQEFLDGAAQVLGRTNVGVYGSFMAIERLVPGWANWGWQTYAWSVGQRSTKAVLYQYHNGVSLCGGEVDLNRAYKEDYGQWGVGNMALSDEDVRRIGAEFVRQLRIATGPDDASVPAGRWFDSVRADLSDMQIDINDILNKIDGLATVSPATVESVKQALREGTA